MEENEISTLRIRYKGTFDFKTLLRYTKDWYYENKYWYNEKVNKEKSEAPFGSEYDIQTWGYKKVSEYIKYEAYISFHLWESKEIIVKIDGKDTKMMEGRIEIAFSAKVITDWQNKFDKGNATLAKLEKFINKVVLRNDINLGNVEFLEKQMVAYGQEAKKILKIAAS